MLFLAILTIDSMEFVNRNHIMCRITNVRRAGSDMYVGVIPSDADTRTEVPHWAALGEREEFIVRQRYRIGSNHTCYYCAPFNENNPILESPNCNKVKIPQRFSALLLVAFVVYWLCNRYGSLTALKKIK